MVAAAAWPQRPLLCVGLLTAAAVCAAGRALVDIDFHFAWQAWRLWHWAGSGGALGSFGHRGCLHGRRGPYGSRLLWSIFVMNLGDVLNGRKSHFAKSR